MFRAALFGSLTFGGYSWFSSSDNHQQQQPSNNMMNSFATAFCKFVKPPFDVQALGNDLFKMLDENPEMGPTLVRLSWHNSGPYSNRADANHEHCANTASMRFEPECKYGANAGLGKARDFLEPLKKKYPQISYADLWTLAAVVAIRQMGGTEIPWRWGRSDAKSAKECSPDGRLPDALQGAAHIRDVFGRMGFSDREAVCLIGGGHAIGKTHKDASGFATKPWKHDFLQFDNGFFTALFGEKWIVDTKNQPKQYTDAASGLLIMLPADIAIAEDPKLKKIAEEYANDNDVFQRDFAKAFQKLSELGTHNLHECDAFKPPAE